MLISRLYLSQLRENSSYCVKEKDAAGESDGDAELGETERRAPEKRSAVVYDKHLYRADEKHNGKEESILEDA